MPLKTTPASGGWGWAWLTPAWAATVRPTISAVAAMLSTAVIQRRIRRVIVTSLVRWHPVVRDHRWFEAAAAPDGSAWRRGPTRPQAGYTRFLGACRALADPLRPSRHVRGRAPLISAAPARCA